MKHVSFRFGQLRTEGRTAALTLILLFITSLLAVLLTSWNWSVKAGADSGAVPCSFPVLDSGAEYAVGVGPSGVAVGDLNNDGKKDMVTANAFGRSISILIADPAGGYRPTVDIDNGCLNGHVALGDLNSDGNLDAVIVSNCQTAGSKISVYRGDGTGALTLLRDYEENAPESVRLADINHDGVLDVFLIGHTGLSIYRGDGSGGFELLHRRAFQDYGASRDFAVEDFNGDGELDVALSADSRVRLWKGNGQGAFTEIWTFFARAGVLAGDFNNDGRLDLVAANGEISRTRLFLGDGAGGFTLTSTVQTPGDSGVAYAAVEDLNGDGFDDVVISNTVANGISVFVSRGDGTFWARQDFNSSLKSGDLVISEMTGDNIPDLVNVSNFRLTGDWMGKVIVTKGVGDGRFRAPKYILTLRHASPSSLVVADLNEDGKDDIIVGNGQLFGVSVLLRTDDLLFAPRRDYLAAKEVFGVTAGDVNSDGHVDVVAVGARQVHVLLGDGSGTLTPGASMEFEPGDLCSRRCA